MNISRMRRAWGLAVLMGAVVVGATLGHAAEVAGPTITGYIDTAYVYSFDKPNNGSIFSRSFDAQDNNINNTLQLAFSGGLGEVGYVVKLLAGNDARVLSLSEGNESTFDLQEAYLTYRSPFPQLGLKIGKMVTLMGIEVVESKDNPTISRGYLFNLAECYTHTGGLVTYSAGKLDLGVGAVNGWDVSPDNNQAKTLVGKVAVNLGDPLFLQLSGLSGSEQASKRAADDTATAFDERADNDGHTRTSLDLTGVTKIIPKLALYFQGNWGQEEKVVADVNSGLLRLASWRGAGVQPVISVTDKLSVGGRVEYFEDPEGARTGTAGFTGTNYTVSPSFKLADNVIIRAEYRYDRANKKVWQDDDGVAKDSSSTTSAEFIVTF